MFRDLSESPDGREVRHSRCPDNQIAPMLDTRLLHFLRVRFRGALRLVSFRMRIDALLRLRDVARRAAQESVDEADGHGPAVGQRGVNR